jgi:hypothetical protein
VNGIASIPATQPLNGIGAIELLFFVIVHVSVPSWM